MTRPRWLTAEASRANGDDDCRRHFQDTYNGLLPGEADHRLITEIPRTNRDKGGQSRVNSIVFVDLFVCYLRRDAGVAGSNPATPTILSNTYSNCGFRAQRKGDRPPPYQHRRTPRGRPEKLKALADESRLRRIKWSPRAPGWRRPPNTSAVASGANLVEQPYCFTNGQPPSFIGRNT
jgi:hypothetical protein